MNVPGHLEVVVFLGVLLIVFYLIYFYLSHEIIHTVYDNRDKAESHR